MHQNSYNTVKIILILCIRDKNPQHQRDYKPYILYGSQPQFNISKRNQHHPTRQMDSENKSENQSAFSIRTTAMIFGALKPKQQKQNYIRNVFSTGFCFMCSRPIPGNPNLKKLENVISQYDYADRLHIYRYTLSILRLLHMIRLYPSNLFPLYKQLFIYTNSNQTVEPLFVTKGFTSYMPQDTSDIQRLKEILNIAVNVPQSYQELVFPQSMQLVSKDDLQDEQMRLLSLNSIVTISESLSEMVQLVDRNPGKLILSRSGIIIRPYDIMLNIARTQSSGKISIDMTFKLVLLYFHMQKQIETYRFLLDELQLYLYQQPVEATKADILDSRNSYDCFLDGDININYYINSSLSSNVIKPWDAVEISSDGKTSYKLPTEFVDHINSIGTELTPMQILRLVLGLSDFQTVYQINDFIFDDDSIKRKDQFIASLSKLPEYYVNSFMQAAYASYKVSYGIPDTRSYFDEAILLYEFTSESAREFIDNVK